MHPNPIFARDSYEDLNDQWLFAFPGKQWQPIRVPFCPQSALSGIGVTDFIRECRYKKIFFIPNKDKRIIIHFGAVDYQTTLFVNGRYAGMHIGGYTPFRFDITDFVNTGKNELELLVRDDETGHIARGKQSYKKQSFGCYYTRTTGIWQSVWLEYVPENHIENVRFYPNVAETSVKIDLRVKGEGVYRIDIFYKDLLVGSSRGKIAHRKKLKIRLSQRVLWEIGKGELYNVVIRYGEDMVHSYFGLREVCYDGYDFLLNGKKVFQKLVLDQGFYPDGIYTAPDADAMRKDIDLSLRLGFNGARLHQKVFDPYFLYLCDRAGYMVWGEFPSWGIDYADLDGLGQFLAEWNEVIDRDFNHPSIITWCPLNEVWESRGKKRDVVFIDTVYEFTRKKDGTRPCVDVSGGHHGHKTDVYDFHNYETVDKLKGYLDKLQREDVLAVPILYDAKEKLRYKKGIPVNLSECGGFSFSVGGESAKETAAVNESEVSKESGWGYGKGETDGESFVRRYQELAELLFSYPKLSGFCYTQLYDVEQERNGFYHYDRSDKLTEKEKDMIKKINNKMERE